MIVTSDKGPESKSAHVYGVAYERYQPGLNPKVFLGLTTGNIDCRQAADGQREDGRSDNVS